MSSFDKLNTEIKEEFIHLCERLINTIGSTSVFCDIAKLYVDTKSMIPQNLSQEDKELAEQVHYIIETIMDWLKISLNYELANIQDQPAYKIRHIKCGVRLASWCCTSIEFVKLLWQNNYNVHKELLNLYEQEFMALSIKLMILKALDTYLQHKFAIEKFLLGNSTNLPKENGYYDTLPVSAMNGYKILVQYMNREPLFSLEGMSILSRLLQKICDHFDQPSLHSSLFVSNQGSQILSMIDPAICLLKQMLAYVIQCQNVNFKDLTTIPIFLHTYNLLTCFPLTAPGYFLAQKARTNIIEALLVYTQPVSEEVNEKDTLTKTLWTQMCGEVIKYAMSSPHTFISGLLIFSELLPLPLPVQTRDDLSKEEISWTINLRKLWSAHLHPHSAVIQEMIADVAANSAIMIARGFWITCTML
ncbi:hypothetical protein NQ318_011974 [Aromia moschata]|uniref:Uncharacterized protein n=1 Tax=Aromia moschata TaxID=1265417 RepID=A0AAV8XYI6_9CUCU|nr:hypothetical protein NQ318_011974 [Aromia moschata]